MASHGSDLRKPKPGVFLKALVPVTVWFMFEHVKKLSLSSRSSSFVVGYLDTPGENPRHLDRA